MKISSTTETGLPKIYRFFGSPVFILQSSLCFDVLFSRTSTPARRRNMPFSLALPILQGFAFTGIRSFFVKNLTIFHEFAPTAHFYFASFLSRKTNRINIFEIQQIRSTVQHLKLYIFKLIYFDKGFAFETIAEPIFRHAKPRRQCRQSLYQNTVACPPRRSGRRRL